MKVLVVYAHHEPTSLTAALKNTSVSALQTGGHEIIESDLYGSGFKPTAENLDFSVLSDGHFNYMLEQKNAALKDWAFSPDIVEELQKLKAADLVIFHFPVWWFSVPAILKGWFDRVLVMGVAWDGRGQTYENGLLKGKKALVVPVAGGREEYYQKEGIHKATMDEVLHPVLHGTLRFCGMEVLPSFVVYNAIGMSDEERVATLEKYDQFLASSLPATN